MDSVSGLGNYEAIFNPSRVNPALSHGVWHGGSGLTGSGTLKGPHGLGTVMARLWVLVSPPTTRVGRALQSWEGYSRANTFYEAEGEFATRWRALKLSSRSLLSNPVLMSGRKTRPSGSGIAKGHSL